MTKPAAIAVVFSCNKSKILLVKRRDVPIWVLPGGGIDKGETPEQAGVREVEEETGVTVKLIRKVAEYYPMNRLGAETHLFECEVVAGDPSPTDESSDSGFFAFDEVPGLLFPVHRFWIEDALKPAGERPIRAAIRGISYWQAIIFGLKHPTLAFCYLKSWKFWRSFFRIETS